jgi:hypothetical protein
MASGKARYHHPRSPEDGDCQTLASLIAPDSYLLCRFLFAVLLIALALLTLLNIALALLALTINVLRTLCGLLFRFLITIRAARLLIHLVFIFHNYLAPSNLRKWCLKDWMEEPARILSEMSSSFRISRAAGFAQLFSADC